MKKNIFVLLVILLISINSFSQESLPSEVNLSTVYSPLYREMDYDMNNLDAYSTESSAYNPNRSLMEWDIPGDSNHIDTFADAFTDPNVVIGVFENFFALDGFSKITAEEMNIMMQGTMEANFTFSLSPMRLVKPIKGKFNKSIIFIRRLGAPYREGLSQIPNIKFAPGAKWVFALRKTTKEFRIDTWSKEIEKYDYLNDDTVFIQFRFGYGALILKWPKPETDGIPPTRTSSILYTEPNDIIKVTESMIEDLDSIAKIMPSIRKEAKDTNDTVMIEKTSQALKSDLAKNIFFKLSKKKIQL